MTIEEIVAQSKASQNKLELKKTLTFVGEIHPKVIVEIGMHRGYSMIDWFKAFDPDLLIGIDIDTKPLEQEFLDLPGDRVHFIEGDSHDDKVIAEVEKILGGRQVDFLFIDGDHHYDAVKEDFDCYEPLVRIGGIIGFHDIMLEGAKWTLAGVEVNRYWNWLIREGAAKYLEFWDSEKVAGMGTGCGIWYKQPPPKVPVMGVKQIGNL